MSEVCEGCGEVHDPDVELPDGVNEWSLLVQTTVRDEVNRRIEAGEVPLNGAAVAAGVSLALGSIIVNIAQNTGGDTDDLRDRCFDAVDFAIGDAAEQMMSSVH